MAQRIGAGKLIGDKIELPKLIAGAPKHQIKQLVTFIGRWHLLRLGPGPSAGKPNPNDHGIIATFHLAAACGQLPRSSHV